MRAGRYSQRPAWRAPWELSCNLYEAQFQGKQINRALSLGSLQRTVRRGLPWDGQSNAHAISMSEATRCYAEPREVLTAVDPQDSSCFHISGNCSALLPVQRK